MKILNRKLAVLPDEIFEKIINNKEVPNIQSIINRLEKFHLSEFEIYNIFNIKPKKAVYLQTIIEEMPDRLNSEEINNLLSIIKEI